jgi:hypothetical protein
LKREFVKKVLLIFLILLLVSAGSVGAWIYFNGGLSLQPADDEEWTINAPPPIQNTASTTTESTDGQAQDDQTETSSDETTPTTSNENVEIEMIEDDTNLSDQSEQAASNEVEPEIEEKPKPVLQLPLSGELAFEANGNSIGSGSFQYTPLPDGGMDLFSEGEFKFKITLVEVTIPFRQQARYDKNLRPTFYASQFKGPLGFGNQSSEIIVGVDRADVTWNKKDSDIDVPDEPFLLMGMFSSYVALWSLIEQMPDRTAEAVIIRGGGPPGEGEDDESSPVSQAKLTAVELPDIEIQSGDEVLIIERFAIAFDDEIGNGGFQFLVKDGQWAGFVGFGEDSDEASLFKVYRADFFPNGLDILGDLKQLGTE